jgi:parallel beta-helix repeat protein
VDVVNSNNITFSDLNLTNNDQGLVLKNTTNSLIENVRLLNNSEGLYLQRCSNNNTIVDNTMSNNQLMGIYVSTSSSNTIENNSISDNAYGLFLDSTVFENTIGYQGSGNTVMNNTVRGNTVANSSLVGVYSIESEDNVLYDNNFVNNTQQVYSVNSTNLWDDGAEGNYWSDYATQHSNATEIGDSGVWDAPYVIDEYNVDYRPLVNSAAVPEFPWPSILIVWMFACSAAIMASQRKRLQRTRR